MIARSLTVAGVLLALGIAVGGPGASVGAQDTTDDPKGGEPVEWKVGELVPDVTLEGSDGRKHRLRDLKGKRAFVIAWYPKSFTGG